MVFMQYGAFTEEERDESVLARSLRDPEAFALLVRRYEEPFLRKARSILGSSEDAEDVVQEAFTKIYCAAPRFKPVAGASFKSWAYRILINTACTKYTKRKAEQGRTAGLTPEHYEALPDNVHEESFHLELSDYVLFVFSKMPESLARVLELHFLQDLPQFEIALEEGVSVGAIKTRVHRAKAEFRSLAEQYTPF